MIVSTPRPPVLRAAVRSSAGLPGCRAAGYCCLNLPSLAPPSFRTAPIFSLYCWVFRGRQPCCYSGRIIPVFDPSTRPPTVLDALSAPGDVAAWAATVAPGADVVAPLAVIDPAKVDDAGRIDLLIAYERQIAWLAAAQQRVLAELDGSALNWNGKQRIDYTQEQVGAALRLSPGHAADRLAVGRTLVDRLPATLALLDRGEITYLHAKNLAESVVSFEEKATGEIEE